MQDLDVSETLPQMVALSEAYMSNTSNMLKDLEMIDRIAILIQQIRQQVAIFIQFGEIAKVCSFLAISDIQSFSWL